MLGDRTDVRRRDVPMTSGVRCALLVLLGVTACGELAAGPVDAAAPGSRRDATVMADAGDAADFPDALLDVGDTSSSIDANAAWSSDAARCNAYNCQGCCSADGTCVFDDDDNACGRYGEPCQVCPPGYTCMGECTHPQLDCDPSNCAGCCVPPLGCLLPTDHSCGNGGEQCVDCWPGYCALDGHGGGTCSVPITCRPATCDGCCQGNTCLTGYDNNACGAGGQTCGACSGTSQCVPTASTGGRCASIPPCGPSNCPGCCYGNDCAYGNQNTACGAEGGTCTDCSLTGQTCVMQSCQ